MDFRSRAEQVEQDYDRLAAAGACREALDLVTREAHVFPEYAQKTVYAWRMVMACRLGERDLALQLLRDAVEAGYWYGDLRTDVNFARLHGMPEFERLADICMARRAEAMASAVPVIETFEPDARYAPYPLLLALHGRNAGIEAVHWRPAVEHGWCVALPQSSQVYAPGAYTWNDLEWALAEVQAHYATLRRERPIDPERVVLGGFSQGAGRALWMACAGLIPARGLVLVGPFLPQVEDLRLLLEARDPRGLHVYLGAGQRDRYCLEVARRLMALLPQYGVVCRLEEYQDLKHAFPADFGERLPAALEFVLADRQ